MSTEYNCQLIFGSEFDCILAQYIKKEQYRANKIGILLSHSVHHSEHRVCLYAC